MQVKNLVAYGIKYVDASTIMKGIRQPAARGGLAPGGHVRFEEPEL